MAEFDRADMVATFRRLALQAGDVILEVYDRDDFGVRAKSDDSPVTEADEAAVTLLAVAPLLAVVVEAIPTPRQPPLMPKASKQTFPVKLSRLMLLPNSGMPTAHSARTCLA